MVTYFTAAPDRVANLGMRGDAMTKFAASRFLELFEVAVAVALCVGTVVAFAITAW
jgi:hypothetical protein